jgi:hypothetical protein
LHPLEGGDILLHTLGRFWRWNSPGLEPSDGLSRLAGRDSHRICLRGQGIFLPVCQHGSLYRFGILRAARFPRCLNLEIHKEQNSGARRLEKIIAHKHGRHIPHNAILQVLLENGLADAFWSRLPD